jgi:uncharacterized DUF497 family protein
MSEFFTVLWDLEEDPDGNVQHIAEHGVTMEEVEEVLDDPNRRDEVSRSSGLMISLGETSTGRFLAVVWDTVLDDPLTIRPVTAYEPD